MDLSPSTSPLGLLSFAFKGRSCLRERIRSFVADFDPFFSEQLSVFICSCVIFLVVYSFCSYIIVLIVFTSKKGISVSINWLNWALEAEAD